MEGGGRIPHKSKLLQMHCKNVILTCLWLFRLHATIIDLTNISSPKILIVWQAHLGAVSHKPATVNMDHEAWAEGMLLLLGLAGGTSTLWGEDEEEEKVESSLPPYFPFLPDLAHPPSVRCQQEGNALETDAGVGWSQLDNTL